MKYIDGEKVLVGDKVRLADGCYGIVVCSLDDDVYPPEYPKAEWEYLKTGVLVKSDQAGLVHYPKDDAGLQLSERSKT
jgi:hypothetical protein